MEYDPGIMCVKNRRYEEAAEVLVKGVCSSSIYDLTTEQLDKLLRKVAQELGKRHRKKLSWAKDIQTPGDIAQEVYMELFSELSDQCGANVISLDSLSPLDEHRGSQD